jgi:hypothetical protein
MRLALLNRDDENPSTKKFLVDGNNYQKEGIEECLSQNWSMRIIEIGKLKRAK